MLMKLEFFTNRKDYLEHVIMQGCLAVSSHNIDTIRGLQTRSSTPGLRSFLGLCNVSPGFESNVARIVAPLNQTFRKDQPHVYTKIFPWRTLNC